MREGQRKREKEKLNTGSVAIVSSLNCAITHTHKHTHTSTHNSYLPPAPKSGVIVITAVSVSILNNISTALSNEVVPRVPGTSIPSRMTNRAPVILLCRRRSLWGPGCVRVRVYIYICVCVCVYVLGRGERGLAYFFNSAGVPHRDRQTFATTHGCLQVAINLHIPPIDKYTHTQTHTHI